MKKIKLIKIIFTLLIIFGVTGCIVTNIHPTPYLEEEDSGIMFGAIDPTNIPAGGTWASVRAVIDANFDNVNGSLDSIEVTLSEYGDSITNYSADIQLRLLKSDTTSMLANYTRNGELNSALAAKVNVSDTATMLGNYTRNGELASALTAKVSVSDTASMLAHYALTSELGDAGTSIGDVRDEIADSLNALRPLYVAVADTAAMLDTYAKLTDLSEGGIGIGAVQDEIADSLNVLRPLVVMVADTASMLTNYALLSEVGTGDVVIGDVRDEIADSLNVLRPLYVAVADTASMLTNYLRASDFAILETRTDSIIGVLADSINIDDAFHFDHTTDTLATKAYARSVGGGGGGVVGITLNSGTITLNGSEGTADDITFYTNGDGSYSLPSGGGTLTLMSQVQGWINDSLDVFRPLYVEVADTATMLTNYALRSEIEEASIDSLILNGGSLRLTGDDRLTFETNGNASYSLPAGGGNLTIMSQVQGWINDTADVIRSEARMIDDTSPYFVFGAGIGEPADSIAFAKGKRGFGAFKVTQDSLHIVDLRNIVISENDSLLFNVYYGNRMTATPVDSLFTGPQSCGDNQTTFTPNNQSTIAPGNDVWIELRADQPEGYRPKEWNLQLNAQIRRL